MGVEAGVRCDLGMAAWMNRPAAAVSSFMRAVREEEGVQRCMTMWIDEGQDGMRDARGGMRDSD